MSSDYLSDLEVDDICAGLVQSAAKVRFLERLGYQVARKPNGRPLARRLAPSVQFPVVDVVQKHLREPDIAGLRAVFEARKKPYRPK